MLRDMSSKLFNNIDLEEEGKDERYEFIAYQDDAKLLPLTPVSSKYMACNSDPQLQCWLMTGTRV